MTTIRELVQRLDPGTLLEMFELDVTPIVQGSAVSKLYFHAGINGVGGAVVWQGNTYQPFPIKADGFEQNTRGTLPRPSLSISNVTGMVTALLNDYDDLVGAKVTRRRTFARYLDAVNFSAGNAEADPNQAFPDEVFYIDRKVSANKQAVGWELVSALDLEGVRLPSRAIIANYCPWRYRVRVNGQWYLGDNPEDDVCPYTGSLYFDATNTPTTDPSKDVCGKTLKSCKARYGKSPLPFGGFPAARAWKV